MLKRSLATLALATLLAAPALAVEPAAAPAAKPAAMDGDHMRRTPPQNRQEAISRAKEHVAKLEKMSDAEWEAKKKERMERREARKERRKDRMEQHSKKPGDAAPAAGKKAE